MDAWRSFIKGNWCSEIDVRNFIQLNYTPYEGDEEFLKGPADSTKMLWDKISGLLKQEREQNGVLDIDTHTISTITSHKPGYIDEKLEKVVGLQTDEPLKRAIMPFGGLRMVIKGCEAYGKKMDPDVHEIFSEYRKTHNDGVYDVYTPEMMRAKKAGIITGLPDAYGRGRIIGDYRRVPLYGVDRLIGEKQYEMINLEFDYIDSDTIRNREEIREHMHDKYAYERLQMALHDREVFRTMACGIAGLSVVADSLSAIKYAKVKAVRNKRNIVVDYEVEGDYPKYGNNDDRVDSIATGLVRMFMDKLRKQRTYRNSMPTLSILTITSNVVYGEKTGNTPDGRKAGEPLAPGANPMHGRDINGALAVLSSIAKLPYEYAQDGISYTFSIIPRALGKDMDTRISNMAAMLDGYFKEGGHHININVFEKETLIDAMEHPEKYPQLTIRVSGYAVNFIRLTREQQLDVINRTIHEHI